jgi:hypothetical protein
MNAQRPTEHPLCGEVQIPQAVHETRRLFTRAELESAAEAIHRQEFPSCKWPCVAFPDRYRRMAGAALAAVGGSVSA